MRIGPNRPGFTIAEILVVLVLLGVVSGIVVALLTRHRLVHDRQVTAVNMNNTSRIGLNVVRAELLQLSAGDVTGGDILAIAPDSIVYRAPRSLFFLCQAPDTVANTITLFATDSLRFPRFGWALTPSVDSLFIYAEADPSTNSDDSWLRANVLRTSVASACPGGAPSYTVLVDGVTLQGVTRGAPVRGTQIWKLKSYRDERGDWWLGAQRASHFGTVSVVQPIVGPLDGSTGFLLEYYNAAGLRTAVPRLVDRVSITVASRSDRRVLRASGLGYATQLLKTDVVLRNNPRH